MVKTSTIRQRPALAALLAFFLSVSIAGCGFHLRGETDLSFDSVYIDSAGTSQFATELRRVFKGNSAVKLVDAPEQAQVVLKVLEERQEQNILSISAAGSVNEFQLLYRVSYRILDTQMQDLVPQQEITVRRDLTYDDTQTLGKESEVKLLFTEMRSDAVQQMLRRLSVVNVPS